MVLILLRYLQELGSGDILLVKTPPAFVMPAVLTSGLAKLAHQINTPIPGLTTPNNLNHAPPSASAVSLAESLDSGATTSSFSDFTSKDSTIPDANALASSLASLDPNTIPTENTTPNEPDQPPAPQISNTQSTTNSNSKLSEEPTEEEYANHFGGANVKRMMGRLKGKDNSLLAIRNMLKGNSAGKGDVKTSDVASNSSASGTGAISPGSPMPVVSEEKAKQRAASAAANKKDNLAPELAELTLEDESSANNSNSTYSGAKSWKFKYTLRSHFDAVWSLVFHPTESVLLSASEDGTWKMWNLQSLAPSINKPPVTELEPVYTFRGHTGPVYSLALAADRGRVLSAGGDAVVRLWTLPPSSLDPYDRHGQGVDYHLRRLEGHTDAIWSLALHPHLPHVLSASSDDTIRLWDYERQDPLLHTLTLTDSSGRTHTPTSVDIVQTNLAQCIASYTSSSLALFDLETGQPSMTIFESGDSSTQINKVISHPTLPLAITAHEDKKISFVDLKSGQHVHTMLGHLDAVASLAIDPSSLYLLSAGHDSSLRFWDISSHACVQEINVCYSSSSLSLSFFI